MSLLGGDFPFEFLHIELVNYFLERPSDSLDIKFSNTNGEQPQNEVAAANKPSTSTTTNLEQMGYRVGYALVERISKDLPRFSSELDCVKFICKEFWTSVFRKQVDNLKTNHQGVYVMQDNRFWLITQFANTEQYSQMIPLYLAFSCGLLRGALSNLNVPCVVTAAVDMAPAAKFSVHIQQKM